MRKPGKPTPSELVALRIAARSATGYFLPVRASQHAMARRMAEKGYGIWRVPSRIFVIRVAGRRAVEQADAAKAGAA